MTATEPALRRVLSGGQTGVDQAALRSAQAAGLEVGGWCPPGRACEDGRIPEDLPLVETPRERSPRAVDVPRSLRTEWNVRDSDATLVLTPGAADEPTHADSGTAWTVEAASLYDRPMLLVDPYDDDASLRVARWLEQLEIETLNVAGPIGSTSPGLGVAVDALLRAVFSRA